MEDKFETVLALAKYAASKKCNAPNPLKAKAPEKAARITAADLPKGSTFQALTALGEKYKRQRNADL